MKSIDPKLDQELCAFLLGWHNLEGDDSLIDMMLSPAVEPKQYTYRFDVLKDIERFLGYPEIQAHDLVHHKMKAHKYYLLKSMGEIIPFDEYLVNTMNVAPVLFSEQKLKALKNEANALLDPFGLKIEENISKNLGAKDNQVKGDNISKLFDQNHADLYQIIHAKTGVTADFNINYKGVDQVSATVAEIRGDGQDYNVLFNMYHMNDYGECKLRLLSAHEISSHAVQFASLRRKIAEGNMPNYLGYVTVHEPIHFSSEGLAETIQYFYPEAFEQNDMMKATLAFHRYRRMVTNNAAVMVNRGASFKESVDYIYENAPDYSIGRTATIFSHQANKPLGSSYYQIYPQALETFLEISQTHPDKDGFIKSVYEDFLMPDQIIAQTRRPIATFF